MVKNWLKFLWPDAYIVFSQSDEGLNATQYIVKDSIEVVDESSFTLQKGGLNKEAKEYIEEFYSAYPQAHIVHLTAAASCSAVAGCSKSQMQEAGVDTSIVKSICKGDFNSYISIMDLENDNLLYKPFELDYNFSPFFIIDEVKGSYSVTDMVCLHRKNRIYVAIYTKNRLVYADNIVIGGNDFDDAIDEDIESVDDDFDLDDLDQFEDDMDDFGGIDDLDDLDDLDDSESEDGDDFTDSVDEDDMDETSELKEYDLHVYEAIKRSIKSFYDDESVASDFIEQIEVLDSLSLSQNVFELIKDELFCEVEVKNIDLHKECLNLVIKDQS